MAIKPSNPLPWWVVTPERFPRTLLGVRFRWPVWWEWVVLAAVYLAILRLGWYPLFGFFWAWMMLRQGALLSYQRPIRAASVALVAVMAVNLVLITALLVGAWIVLSLS